MLENIDAVDATLILAAIAVIAVATPVIIDFFQRRTDRVKAFQKEQINSIIDWANRIYTLTLALNIAYLVIGDRSGQVSTEFHAHLGEIFHRLLNTFQPSR